MHSDLTCMLSAKRMSMASNVSLCRRTTFLSASYTLPSLGTGMILETFSIKASPKHGPTRAFNTSKCCGNRKHGQNF